VVSLILLLALPAHAADPLPDAVVSAFQKLATPKTVQAEFVQTQYRKVLTRPFESHGKIAFSRPDALRWEVTAPAPAIFVMQGAQMGMRYPALDVTEHLSLDGRPELLGLVKGLTIWLHADTEALRSDYEVTEAAGQPLALTLVPKNDTLHKWIASIGLVLSADSAHVDQVTLTEPDGDRSEIAFHDVVLDQPLPPQSFELP